MKTHFACLILFLSASLLSAQSVVWKGGFPGHETDWSFPRNWNTGRVPDEFDTVKIPDCSTSGNFYPVIGTRVDNILGLEIASGAKLTLARDGYLIIDGSGLPSGQSLLKFGTIYNDGILEVANSSLKVIAYEGMGLLIHRR